MFFVSRMEALLSGHIPSTFTSPAKVYKDGQNYIFKSFTKISLDEKSFVS